MKDFEIVKTADGSHSVYVPSMDEHYHSYHGALNEAKHVFIANGIQSLSKNNIRVLEVGFGTGLNALLSLLETKNREVEIYYEAYETVILPKDLVNKMNYSDSLQATDDFLSILDAKWGEKVMINSNFYLKKVNCKIQEAELKNNFFDLVYYDAFGPRAQAAMWDKEIFKKIFDSLVIGGVLVTYCAMGQLKRDLKSLGFKVESLPGPPGKREMTKAIKL